MYTVKEVAELLGVSVHTVRYYDDKGLIPGTKRNSANQRLFDDDEVEWLFVSLTLKNTGLSLKEVKRYIELYQQGNSTLLERYKIMTAQKEKTLAELEALKLWFRNVQTEQNIKMYEIKDEIIPENRICTLEQAEVYVKAVENYMEEMKPEKTRYDRPIYQTDKERDGWSR
ncbi:MAG: MerR family transcriptional regulator [Lachnospiraceae bacterium]|nr:MerR family transcriptional regulator [Lachnospiraceae bacterium]